MPPVVAAVLDVTQAGGSATISERRGGGALSAPYTMGPVRGWLQNRLNQFIGYQQGTGQNPPTITGTIIQQILNDLDAFTVAIPFPSSQLLNQSTDNALALRSTLISDLLAEFVLTTDLANAGTGKAYNSRLQILLNRDSVNKLNNFTYFLLTLMP